MRLQITTAQLIFEPNAILRPGAKPYHWKPVQPTAQRVRHFTATFKVIIIDLRLLDVTNGNIWDVQDLDTRHLDNIIYLTGEPEDVLHPFRACRRWC